MEFRLHIGCFKIANHNETDGLRESFQEAPKNCKNVPFYGKTPATTE